MLWVLGRLIVFIMGMENKVDPDQLASEEAVKNLEKLITRPVECSKWANYLSVLSLNHFILDNEFQVLADFLSCAQKAQINHGVTMHGRLQNAPKVSDFYPLRTVPLYGWKTLISKFNGSYA